MKLVVCTGCRRFVREDTCPFCGASVDIGASAARASPGNLTRGALAFGAVSALGVAAGVAVLSSCGTAKTEVASDGGAQNDATFTADATADAPIGFDANVQPGAPSYGACPAAVDVTMIPAWKAPAPFTAGACTNADLDALNAKASDVTATFTDIYNVPTSPGCRACVFSDEGDPNWQPFVWSPDKASGNAFVNFGACYALASGGSDACGNGLQDAQFCIQAACPDICTDLNDCMTDAMTGVCAKQQDAQNDACGSAINALNAACGKAEDAVRVVCGPATADGGSINDSGSD